MQNTGVPALGETTIAMRRAKMIFNLVAACVFVLASAFLLAGGHATLKTRITGIIGILFFGAVGLWALRRLANWQPGLVLSAKGINDRSSGVAMGFVPWSDIRGFGIHRLGGAGFLIVQLADARKYARRGNVIQRMFHRANMGMCGSPMTLSSTGLAIGLDDLERLCRRYLATYGGGAGGRLS